MCLKCVFKGPRKESAKKNERQMLDLSSFREVSSKIAWIKPFPVIFFVDSLRGPLKTRFKHIERFG
ncbi:hypothetical protein RHMOL_Rhmol11G0061100 [Rhododendron molle]|uniref:Uncharacterized protein n=1 Tax=Rhododendron molle TaxID=49168 RepID=A0ACC0LQ53_RHOML|nr:hypothetical protein RHMOL_Rhmol11G0061100 [Rhododendron molle]